MKLLIGGGTQQDANIARVAGWKILDANKDLNPDVYASADVIPLEDDSCSVFYASHILEHIPWRYSEETVKEWGRVVRAGGRIYVAVPDLAVGCRLILDNLEKIGGADGNNPPAGFLYGGQAHPYDFHLSCFTERMLRLMLQDAGFTKIRRFDGDDRRKIGLTFIDHSCPEWAQIWGTFCSLNLTGEKK